MKHTQILLCSSYSVFIWCSEQVVIFFMTYFLHHRWCLQVISATFNLVEFCHWVTPALFMSKRVQRHLETAHLQKQEQWTPQDLLILTVNLGKSSFILFLLPLSDPISLLTLFFPFFSYWQQLFWETEESLCHWIKCQSIHTEEVPHVRHSRLARQEL